MKVSIVTTLYKSSSTVAEFHRRAVAAAETVTPDFEIIMVDDGSPDDSLAIACQLAEQDSRVRVVELSRNFGHHKALMTGLDHADGDLCFLIGSDLEEDPALLRTFFDKLESNDAEVVYGYQDKRKGGLVERATGDISYRLFNLLIPYPIPRNHITVRLMRREYFIPLLCPRERRVVLGGLWSQRGFRQSEFRVNKRGSHVSTY